MAHEEVDQQIVNLQIGRDRAIGMAEHVAPGRQGISVACLRTAGEDKPVRRDLKAKLRSVITGHLERGGNLIGDRDGYVLTGLGLADHQIAFIVLHVGPAEPRQFARARPGQQSG